MRIDGFDVLVGAIICAFCGVMALLAWAIYKDNTDPVWIAEREARDYERAYPCVNGIRYIRSGNQNAQSLTPMIDPATMQPQLCGAER